MLVSIRYISLATFQSVHRSALFSKNNISPPQKKVIALNCALRLNNRRGGAFTGRCTKKFRRLLIVGSPVCFSEAEGFAVCLRLWNARLSNCHSALQKILIHEVYNPLLQVVSSPKKICQGSKLHTAGNVIIKENSAILAVAPNNSS